MTLLLGADAKISARYVQKTPLLKATFFCFFYANSETIRGVLQSARR